MAQAFDEPLVVVGLDEGGDPLAEIVHVLEEPRPEALLLDGPHEAFGHAIALGLADEGGSSSMPSQLSDPWKWWARVLAAPVVAELDAPGHIGSELVEAIDDGRVSVHAGQTLP